MNKKRKAFTLLEILLAMAIAGMVMVACVSLLFSMVKLLDDMENSEPLENHANNVEKFLRSAFLNSTFPDRMPSDLTSNISVRSGNIYLGQNPEVINSETLNLFFGIVRDHPFFLSRNQFSKEKACWLEFREGDGLYLTWSFTSYEEDETECIIYENLISKYVVGVGYLFYSELSEWEEESELSTTGENAGQMPLFLCLYFSDGNESYKRIIPLFSLLETGNATPSSGQQRRRN